MCLHTFICLLMACHFICIMCFIPKKSFMFKASGVRTFVLTNIRSHTIFDRAGHLCSYQITTTDIHAHIKWPPRTFVLTSNYHPGHSCSYQMTTPDIRAHIKLPPRTFVLISNYHPGHSCSHQITTPDIRAHIKWPPRTFVLTSNYHPDIRSHDYSVL